jgi:RNA polymerase sigma-70 factor (ECF subfamily)
LKPDDLDPGSAATTCSPFATTHWSVVQAAGREFSPEAQAALERVCQSYWYPLYAYVRRTGRTPEDSQDLVQEFFAHFLERNYLRLADQNRGRFRTFLLTSLKHFLINDWRKATREKRGGRYQILSLDVEKTETRFRAEPVDGMSPEKLYDRRWATVLLDRVLDQLKTEFAAANRRPVFEELKSFLTGEGPESTYAEIGGRLGMTEGSLKVTVHRMRRRYRELLRKEISTTVDTPEAVEEEVRELFLALGN